MRKVVSQWARKLKRVQAKKTREIKLNQLHNRPNNIFAISKMTKNKFFELGKSF